MASMRDHSHSLPRNLADTLNRRGHPTPHQVAASIRDHSHFVLGVGWDPLDEYVVTVSSDRCGILGSWDWGLGSDLDLDLLAWMGSRDWVYSTSFPSSTAQTDVPLIPLLPPLCSS